MKLKKHKQNIVAIVYDFDETLTPLPMQDYTILPMIGIKKGGDFWKESNAESLRIKGDKIITYMRLIIKKATEKEVVLKREDFQRLGGKIQYFNGIPAYFSRINNWVRSQYGHDVKLEHYIISAGLKEILDGIKIRRFFKKVYASEYYYKYYDPIQNKLEDAIFPKIIVNDTIKTEYMFRINKGALDYNESINTHMKPENRRIPFKNIVYIGDGMSDVPCMTLTKKEGGRSIAVYKSHNAKGKKTCRDLLEVGRVDFAVPADYSKNSKLEQALKAIITAMGSRILLERKSLKQSI